MSIILLGPPGAGKGTVADRLKHQLGLPHISSGEIFRENIEKKTAMGVKVKHIIERGDLVPDEVTVAMVRDRLEGRDAAGGFILDGFPRTLPQAEALAAFAEIDHAINLICSNEEILRRLTGRRVCSRCGRVYHVQSFPPALENVCDDDGEALFIREDDRAEAVKRRLRVYEKSTQPLIDWYRENQLLRDVDASADPDRILRSITAILAR